MTATRPAAIADEPSSDRASIWSALVQCTETWTNLDPGCLADIDWNALIEAAHYHGVLPIVAQRVLESQAGRELDRAITARLRRALQISFMRSLPLVQEIARITTLFRNQGLGIIPYKGPALAETLWGNAALRECVDLDFLVRQKDVNLAGELLNSLGYARVDPVADHLRPAILRNASEEQFRHCESGLLLELQWEPAPKVFALRFDAEEVWNSARKVQFAGQEVLAPAPEFLLLLLCIHGWKHNWSKLIWLGDIAQLIRSEPLNWEQLLTICKRDRTLRIVALGLHIAAEVFNSEVPELFQISDSALKSLAQELINRMKYAHACKYLDWHRCMLAARDSRMDRVHQITSFLFTPGLGEYASCKLPRWAAWGYRAVRVARLALLATHKSEE